MKTLNKNIFKLVVVTIVALLSISTAKSQDGEALFKSNCSACHKLEGMLVGPGLKGVKAKWVEAGEEANLTEWVKNPTELFNSGKSEMAKIAWEISPIAMSPVALSDDEISAIFDYVENAAAQESSTAKTGGNAKKNAGAPLSAKKQSQDEIIRLNEENRSTRRNIFIFLLLTAICLIFGILSISKASKTLSELKNKRNGGAAAVLLALVMLSPFSGYPLGFSFENSSWFSISNTDNIVLFIINLLLLGLLLFKAKVLFGENEIDGDDSVMNALTDTVAVEDEASILMDHEYDGIQELDNNLPPWWVWSFYASIIFAFIYLFHYHVLGTGDLQGVEHDKDVAAAQIKVDEYMSTMSMNIDENNVVVLAEASDIETGKSLYKTNCVVCHKESGEGLVGPNLTDKFWLYGEGDIKTIFKTIKLGTSNGMPEHESKMNPIELQQVASYILTFDFVEGKAPEGTEIK